eukprot:CAMPEP_0184862002 /NCGR_PEP_ID=MMETSP0580-20130426/6551_1 /TAXON_ID=1118495 /ORGANISM="Dactyliosolen fragilissimus" /LENGTH=220 /DNA_ID=CAMNT_0027359699 /DNA_START=93 /DNA_END=755 /DNA_ORIENTATION=-
MTIQAVIIIFLIGGNFRRNVDDSKHLACSEQTWHGGNPAETMKGSCWCGSDAYCMCTPSLAIDLVITSGPDHLILVRRKDTNQLATMGGFVEVGESVENAVAREVFEETGITLSKEKKENLKLFGIYSDPRRDSRRHTASAVFVVDVPENIETRAGDDAKEVLRISIRDIGGNGETNFFSDHLVLIEDYKAAIQGESNTNIKRGESTKKGIIRSICGKFS